ncbi:hypothetical protein JoomaDRAFT_3727 [Galbibacter orientalis DSM 19592]|uniref:Uncharacterized protein n=1 Tax=Galbibacter orientalis DSM 19592 TaxID=926559 RepID=I3CAL7_9FLAO|nr:hypothetical protein JoomaDRAFT_3727 [Galbibacter orientalis DSM 19592]
MMVYVFKTSVTTQRLVNQLTPNINKICKNAKWNFDLEDCDNIFRMETIQPKDENLIPKIISFSYNFRF